ncbi:hypothetical protein ACVIRM_007043 [Rhizobium laguerreae]
MPQAVISGDIAGRSRLLEDYGLRIRRLDGPLGAASALKMCYAGINKGFIGLGTAMLLPDVDRKLSRSIPDMYPKAYRWVAEMQEIADFLGEDDPAATIFRGMADVFARMADDVEGSRLLVGQLDEIIASSGSDN